MPNLVRKSSGGFTLIELLITISIIALLAGLSLVSFGGIQKQARDTERKSDLKQYQSALVAGAGKNSGFYPLESSTVNADENGAVCTDLSMTTCPADPKKDGTYDYKYQSDGSGSTGAFTATRYVLWALLEDFSTSTYWVVCSNGKSGSLTAGIPPTGGTCPL